MHKMNDYNIMAKSDKPPKKDVLSFIGGAYEGDYTSKDHIIIKDEWYTHLYYDGVNLIYDLELYLKNNQCPTGRHWIHRYVLSAKDRKYHWDGYFPIESPS